MNDPFAWRPTATREVLQARAALLARTRQFFAERHVLEVDTPILVGAPVTDTHIHSAEVSLQDADRLWFLHTSPEYAMKRLLAAGSGDLFQICHVVRGFEQGRLHNAEFTLIEWYRLGFSLEALMDEVEALIRTLVSSIGPGERVTYREAFIREIGIDPLEAPLEQLRAEARKLSFESDDRDEVLDLLMAAVVGPGLGLNGLTFVHRYPASQAALARLDPLDPRTALRFEVYANGIELANGFHELASAAEQRMRFEIDQAQRRERRLPVHALDEHLLAALQHGLPDCAGVAVGFDRVAMLALGAQHIDEVLPFPTDRA